MITIIFANLLLAAISLALPAVGDPNLIIRAPPGGRECVTQISHAAYVQAETYFAKFRPPAALFHAPDDSTPVEIDVYWNIIYENKTYEGGYVPRKQIQDQMRVLNEDFSETGLHFRHVHTKRIRNPKWFNDIDGEEVTQELTTAMKTKFRTGGADVLNVYAIGMPNVSTLGWATFPSAYKSNPIEDGIVLRYTTMPGGSNTNLNLGRTLTHEAGHWVGLYHTFEGGCESGNGGDLVSDTTPEAEPAYGCTVRDSCPNFTGDDPITNFMDYTDDSCMDHFTSGQIRRLKGQLRTYREIAI